MRKTSSRGGEAKGSLPQLSLAQSKYPHPACWDAGQTRYDMGILFDHVSILWRKHGDVNTPETN